MSEEVQAPEDFTKVILDFAKDLVRTFPDKITEEGDTSIFKLNRAAENEDTEGKYDKYLDTDKIEKPNPVEEAISEDELEESVAKKVSAKEKF